MGSFFYFHTGHALLSSLFLPLEKCTTVAFTFCLVKHFSSPIENPSSHTDTGCFADQVSLGWKTLLRVEELRHSHAGPQRPGECDCQAITSKAASHANSQFQ